MFARETVDLFATKMINSLLVSKFIEFSINIGITIPSDPLFSK